jgi:hypothetical protein
MLDVGITKVEVFLKFDGGIRKVEVVAKGEDEVLKEEVLQTSNLDNCAKRITSSFLIPTSNIEILHP